MQAVEKVLDGAVERAFAVVRPPGHHAESSAYMGFCFYNNAGVAAHAALARGEPLEQCAAAQCQCLHGVTTVTS